MIPTSVREEISRVLGSEPRRYVIRSLSGDIETDCECWDLPPLKEEDKPIHVRYREIEARVVGLRQADPDDPQIQPLLTAAHELLQGAHVTKRYGVPLITMDELLKLDKWKGIRREWWELHDTLPGKGVCIFQGYRMPSGAMVGDADMLIAMPSADRYDFLRIHGTRGNNRPVDTEGIIAALRKLDAEYGVGIVSAAGDSVEFILERDVQPAESARIRRRLKRLCSSAEALSDGIRLGRVALWWD